MEVKWMTTHAKEKYRQVTDCNKEGALLEEEIFFIFSQARKEEMNAGLVKRIMDNDFEWTEFYLHADLRFTVCMSGAGDYYIRTIEEDKFKDKSLGYIRKDKRRKGK